MKNKFYITTTLPYVNAPPHVGFALEIIQADVIARYQAGLGNEIFFNTGTDEHGLKIYQKAVEEKKDPQKYCDEYAIKFDLLKNKLNLSYNNFIRTTDSHHIKATQEIWRRCEANGDIYKKNYKTKYCVGCELEKTDSELKDGRCSIHPNREIEIIEEENYFFRFSKYQKALLNFYDRNPNFIIPSYRQKEIYNFVKSGLRDFSISRLKTKLPWGVSVPGDAPVTVGATGGGVPGMGLRAHVSAHDRGHHAGHGLGGRADHPEGHRQRGALVRGGGRGRGDRSSRDPAVPARDR